MEYEIWQDEDGTGGVTVQMPAIPAHVLRVTNDHPAYDEIVNGVLKGDAAVLRLMDRDDYSSLDVESDAGTGCLCGGNCGADEDPASAAVRAETPWVRAEKAPWDCGDPNCLVCMGLAGRG